MPVPEGVRWCNELLVQSGGNRTVEAHALVYLGVLRAMEGEFEESRRLVAAGRGIYEDLGWTVATAATTPHAAFVERLAGRPAEAETLLRSGFQALERAGEKGFLSTVACDLAETVYLRGEYHEAERFAQVSNDTAATDDVRSQVGWRGVRAKIAARRGRVREGEVLAREAVAIAERTDYLQLHGDALMDLAEVVRLAGRQDEAADAVRTAIDLYDRKGSLISAGRARSVLGELGGSPESGNRF
jgi:ATP/maltotriose-dependent transcriptional regulator MalT